MKKKHIDGLNNPYSFNRYLGRKTHWSPNKNKTKTTVSTNTETDDFEFEIDLTIPAIILIVTLVWIFQ